MSARGTTFEKLRSNDQKYTYGFARIHLLAREPRPIPPLKHFLQASSSDLFEHVFVLLVHESSGDGPLAQAHLVRFTKVKRSTEQQN